VLAALLAARHVSAATETVKPWHPPAGSSPALKAWMPESDSLTRLVNSAKLRFQRQRGDTVSGDNFDGYEIVGDMGRHMLSALGRNHWLQAQAIEATLDSMGLDVEVRTDPEMQFAAFMLVRNPFQRTSNAVGFLYWLRKTEVRMQGASYPPSHNVKVKFWFNGGGDVPYEAVTLFHMRNDGDRSAMRLYRLNDAGVFWDMVQYEGNGPDLQKNTEANFADLNGDGRPEIIAYHKLEPDSFFVISTAAPPLLEEYTYTERQEGYVLHDLRAVPGPSETLHLFASLLLEQDIGLARRLTLTPAHLDTMLAAGWGRHGGKGAWNIEYGERAAWPEWLEAKVRQDSGWKHWLFHFAIQDGRWVIQDWIPEEPPEKPSVEPLPVRASDTRPVPITPGKPGKSSKPGKASASK
jgi:hypothetical protein